MPLVYYLLTGTTGQRNIWLEIKMLHSQAKGASSIVNTLPIQVKCRYYTFEIKLFLLCMFEAKTNNLQLY